ncbi:MAG: dephospho-CoA kinase [Candidatus Thiodiazotropha sp. (ex Myrtea sp. 'scaly one' KF741663)]|nr:dephospho-CoA kinase [Candidatus Thiodiazotropha sp. (ex Myrtea sp. 'scaly one' KF741663)]
MMLVVALTGGIGSGKSAVSHHLESLGVPVIDADRLAHKMVEPNSPALEEIQSAFGHHLIDTQGRLDRATLREIVFDNPSERKRLEAILHPRIKKAMEDWLKVQSAPYAILVIPLLFETSQMTLADRVLLVDSDESLQIKRVSERDGLSREQITQILDAQVDRRTRLSGADDIIDNNGNLDDLIQATNRQHEFYMAYATKKN